MKIKNIQILLFSLTTWYLYPEQSSLDLLNENSSLHFTDQALTNPQEEKGSLPSTTNPYGQQVNPSYQHTKGPSPFFAWENSLFPWNREDRETILLNFINADLLNVIKFFEEKFSIIFILDDVLNPLPQGGKSLYGTKVNFTSHVPLSREEAWNIFISLLEIAGVTITPGSTPRTYRLSPLAKDSPLNYAKGPLPIFMNIPFHELPQSDMRIRYLYQVKNISLQSAFNVIKTMQSPASPDPIEVKEVGGILFTDRIFNIKTVLQVIEELDQLIEPEKIAVIKVKKSSAEHIVNLYKNIIKEESGPTVTRLPGTKRKDMLTYFDPQVRLIPDSRNNLIIALGNDESIQRVRNFIEHFQDIVPKTPYLPVHTYQLQYTESEAVANVLRQSFGFKGNSETGKHSGVENGQKFLTDVFILAEPNTNSLLVQCSDESYKYVYDVIKKIDIEPKQVAVDIVIVSVDMEKIKQLGAQLRNNTNQTVNWQTGLLDKNNGVVGNYNKSDSEGAYRLLGNLLQIFVNGGNTQPGTTVMSLGSGPNGVWGIVKALMQEVNAKIINQPFLLATDRYEAQMSVGETRRIAATSITNANNEQQSYTSDQATLAIKLTANISDSNSVLMNLDISNSFFTAPEGNNVSAGNKTTRNVTTTVSAVNGEKIAISGLIIDHSSEVSLSVPWISKIPILGTFFSNEEKQNRKSMLIIFIQPKILLPEEEELFNAKKIAEDFEEFTKNNRQYKIACPLRKAFFHEKSIIDKYEIYNQVSTNFLKKEEALYAQKILRKKSEELPPEPPAMTPVKISTRKKRRQKKCTR
jgi:type II secretory pathway component GspD/PulD (secretin)